jgi:STE24 endopeptidase
LALLLALAAVWAVAAALLWRSSVPGGLRLPHVDLRSVFTSAELSRAARFARFERADWALSQLALVLVLVFYARHGVRLMKESAAGRIGTGMLLGMLGFAFVWLSQVPFAAAALWWERRYGVSKVGYFEWLLGNWLGLGAEFLFLCFALLIVMALAGPLGNRWWLAGGPAFVAVAALFVVVSPYLQQGTHPLNDSALAADARALERAEGLGRVRIDVQVVSDQTTAPNAMALGLGPTRRIIVWDTLLDFPRRQVRVVLAHELGHLSRNHLPKGLAWYALFALPGAWLIARLTRRRGGMRDPAAVPLSLLVLVVSQLLALPLQNAISRRFEAEADWVALQATRDPQAARAMFHRLAVDALVQPRPPTWAYVLLDDHPTIQQRLAMAEAWQRR